MKKVLLATLSILAITFCSIFYLFYRSKPVSDGVLFLEGIEDKVRIVRDKWGVPHITSENEKDAYYALGFVMASERLFQMDIQRRLANGQLSEILGKRTLAIDKKFRTLRLRKAMVELMEKRKKEGKRNEVMWSYLTAFYKGVNAYIKKNPLPVEFLLLGYEPKPFDPYDAFAFSGYMGYSFATSFRKDVLFSSLASTLSPEMFEELRAEPSKPKKIVEAVSEFSLDNILNIHEQLKEGFYAFEGSNAWALSGKRSKSGFPLLASDPHIGFALPGVWFEAHLKTPQHEIYGHFLPLVPFPALGHNKHIAWGLTMSKVDDMDFYQEKISPDGKKVQFKGRWVPLREYEEEIAVKGQEPEILKIRVTPHGPLLDQVMEGRNISMKWSYYHPENFALEALFKGERAKNWEEFTSAFSLGGSPGLHIAYADAEGNIGSFVFGKIPKRPPTMFSDRILDGSSGRHEYSYLPFSKNPQSFNPESGVIVLANWRPPKSEGISGFWSPSDRYDTIKGLLETKEKWSIEELKKVQTATYSKTSELILQRLLNSITHQDLTPLEKKAVTYLKKWDQQSSIESIGATLYHQWNLENKRLLFDELSKKQRDTYCGLGSHWFSYKRLLEQQKASWWDLKSTTTKIENRDEVLLLGLKKAVAFLEAKYGQDPSKWNWGKIHTVEYVHPLGKIAPLNHLFNLGPYPAPGGYEQINNLSSKGCKNDFKIVSGPSTRRLIDFKTPGFSWGILPLGNSGHKLSPYYKDQQKMFLNGEYRYQLMNASVIEKNKVNELLLVRKRRSKKSI